MSETQINISDTEKYDYENVSLGTILKERRQSLHIEISDISSALNIKARDIISIENDEIDSLSCQSYISGLIRSYGKILRLDNKVIEKKLRVIGIKSNVENKKYKLVNIGENFDLIPDRDEIFAASIVSVLLFLVLLLFYNYNDNKGSLITNSNIISEFDKVN